MSKVFFSIGITIDGYIAGPNGGAENPLGDRGTEIHRWAFKQKIFREHLGSSEGGETGKDNQILENIYNRIGANILGKKMFIEGEANWPENAPFHTPVFVLTHEKREPWERPGGTTFYFTDDNIQSVLERAKQAAGGKDVRISGGASIIQQYLNAGLIDEFVLHITPIILGQGVRLFEDIDHRNFTVEVTETVSSPEVMHMFYKVKK